MALVFYAALPSQVQCSLTHPVMSWHVWEFLFPPIALVVRPCIEQSSWQCVPCWTAARRVMPEGPRRFEGGFLSLPGKDDRIGMPSKGRLIAGPGAKIRTTQDGTPASRHWFDCKLSTTVACVRRRTDVDMSPCHTGPVTKESRAKGGPVKAREPVKRTDQARDQQSREPVKARESKTPMESPVLPA